MRECQRSLGCSHSHAGTLVVAADASYPVGGGYIPLTILDIANLGRILGIAWQALFPS